MRSVNSLAFSRQGVGERLPMRRIAVRAFGRHRIGERLAMCLFESLTFDTQRISKRLAVRLFESLTFGTQRIAVRSVGRRACLIEQSLSVGVEGLSHRLFESLALEPRIVELTLQLGAVLLLQRVQLLLRSLHERSLDFAGLLQHRECIVVLLRQLVSLSFVICQAKIA